MSDTADQPANKRQATRPASTLGRRAANQAMFDAAKQMVDEERATRRASTGGQPSVEEAMFDAATQLVNSTEPTVLRLHRDQVVVIRDSLRVINLTPRDPTLPQTNFMVHGATEPGAIDVKMDPKTKEGWLTKAAAIHYYIDRGRRDVITTVRGVIDEHGTSRGEVIATIREVINM
ncbi:hypothetical protein Daus18300_000037 [Diaporthe australafricana]|uniref:Uncharacterized protein n=1 Tax=Diaporthe australafricana TaxID=127596 RepID=A0ABR3Y6M9_9PEZI